MRVIGHLARLHLRRHRASFIGVSALVALVGGVALASLLGADRTATALDRFVERTNAADIGVFAEDAADLERLAARPGVATADQFTVLALVPSRNLGRDGAFFPMFAMHDSGVPEEVNGYLVVTGRPPDPAASDEIALHESTAAQLDVTVGDRLRMQGLGPADVDRLFTSGDPGVPSGPTVDMRVVAIVRDPLDVVVRAGDIIPTILSPAVYRRFAGDVGSLGEGSLLTLEPGASVASVVASIREESPDVEIERWVGSTPIADTGFGPSLDLTRNALVALAGVLLAAGGVVLWQAVARGVIGTRSRLRALEVLGLERRMRILVGLVPALLASVVGAVGAVAVALLLSPRFPVGIARRAEPDPGIDADPRLLTGGVVVLVLAAVVAAAAVAVTIRAPERSRSRHRRTPSVRLSPTTAAVASGNAALLRSTRVAIAFGGAVVAAALVFATSLDHLLTTPRLFGWSFDTAVAAESFDAATVRAGADVAHDPAVAEVAPAVFQIELDIEGSPAYGDAIGDGTGEIQPVVARGRAPVGPDEIAVGRETLSVVGKSVGDQLSVDAGNGPVSFHIVGQSVLPVGSDGGRVGDGVAVTTAALGRLGLDPDTPCDGESCFRQLLVRWKDGADVTAARSRLLTSSSAEFERAEPPAEVERLREVDAIPWLLAAVLTFLSAGAAGHAIFVTVHRTEHSLAVLRALGETPGRTSRAVLANLGVVAGGAAAVGVVVGVAAGRWAWLGVAGSVGVRAVADMPVVLVLALPIVLVLLTDVVALAPASRATRSRPARALRSE